MRGLKVFAMKTAAKKEMNVYENRNCPFLTKSF